MLITHLLLVLEVWDANQLTRNHGWESSGVVVFDLGLLLQGQTRIAKPVVLITWLLLVLDVSDGKLSYGK